MSNQRERDRKCLNSRIRRQAAQKKRTEATEERYQKIFDEHIEEKYGDVSF